MSIVLLHHNETIFPQSHTFLPERWLAQSQRRRLDKYMVSFGKGSRQCLGMEYVYFPLFIFSNDVVELQYERGGGVFFKKKNHFSNFQLIVSITLPHFHVASFPYSYPLFQFLETDANSAGSHTRNCT